MEMEGGAMVDSSMMSTAKQTLNILCCMCGISFNPQQTKTNICVQCLSSQTDITLGITKQGILNFCRMCRRYNRPPWVYMERESRDLLTLCLKKIKGLNNCKLLDAQFVWTEPHSRRIKIKLTIQKEVINNASLQHTFEVEFYEHYMQCDDCKKEFTPHTWGAVVQVRQRVAHKRTFYFLEQLILRNNAHSHLIKIEEKHDGLDFYYKNKSHALRLVDFLGTILPMKVKASKQLVSYDEQNDIYQTKYSWSAEIPKICKDDLVIIPPKLCKELGGACPLQLCLKLTNTIRLLDTKTMKRIELTDEKYNCYEKHIKIVTLKENKSEFMVNDCEKMHDQNLNESYQTSVSNLFINKIYKVNLSRTSDWECFDTKTHLGTAIKPGAILEGYDMTKLNIEELEHMKNIPEVIIVKRVYDKTKRKNRIWKLNRIDKEGVMVDEEQPQNTKKRISKAQNTASEDFEDFMDDVEVNPDMQKNIRMYKNKEAISKLTPAQLERRNRQKKRKERKVVVITNTKKTQETNIFNKKEELEQIPENEEFKKPESKQQQPEIKDEDESDYEEDEVKLFQLEEYFENIKIDENDDIDGQDNDEAIDDFIQNMDKKMNLK